jgi:hypothetical protein
MFGQLWEPLPPELPPELPGGAWLPWSGAVGVVRAGAVVVVVGPPLELVELVDVAALAIAAPPPAIAAVAATVTSNGFSLGICSPPFVVDHRGRSSPGVGRR